MCFLLPPVYTVRTLHGHLSKTYRNAINDAISTASFLTDCKLPSLSDVFNTVFKNDFLQTSATDNEPVLHVERLPPEGYQNIKGQRSIDSDLGYDVCNF